MNCYITSFGLLDNEGIYSNNTTPTSWRDDQSGPLSVDRAQVFEKPHMGFGKLCAPDKLAFSAASLALAKATLPDDRSRIGICVATMTGSLSTDMAYMTSIAQGVPAPALFAATLPSTPVAEIAIMHKLTGPDRVFCGINGPADALDAAERLILLKKAAYVVCVAISDGSDGQAPWAAALLLGGPTANHAIAPLPARPAHTPVDLSYFKHLVTPSAPH